MAQVPDKRTSGALAVFAYRKGPLKGQEVEIRRPSATIGQGGDNDVVIQDDSVSTRHARIEYESGGWRITDLNSTNGTYVEGVRLAPEVPTPLSQDEKLRFGGAEFDFHLAHESDIEVAVEGVEPFPDAAPIAPRRRFRMPLWLAVILVLAILVALFVIGWLTTGQGLPVEATTASEFLGESFHVLI